MISISYNPGWSGLSEIPDSIRVITNLYHKSLRCPPFLIHVSGLPRVVSVARICSNKSTASDEWLRASTGPATESCPATRLRASQRRRAGPVKGAVLFAWVWVTCECGGAENIPPNETPAPTSTPNQPKKLKLSLNKPDISVKETRDLHCSDCILLYHLNCEV